MKMKKIINIKCLALILGLFAITASCTNDDLINGGAKDNKQIDGTVFVGGKSSASASAKSRTAFNYLPSIGANSKFVWTVGDRIFLADGSVSEPLTGGYDEKFDVADFVFRGKNFTAPSYDIYYPGYGGTTYNKLIISTDNGQTYYDYQITGKFYAYPRADGGFAKAIRQPDGKYYFELEHLCAFLYLTPYVQTDRLGEQIRVEKIKITADKNIAGDFTITPTGLVESANGSKTIEANSQSTISGTIGGPLRIYSHGTQKIRDYTSWLFHFAPANTKLKIEYKINIPVFECGRNRGWPERLDSIVTKNIPLYSYGKNTVTPITSSIFFPMYKAIYSRWDAKKDYSEFADTVLANTGVNLPDKYKNNTDYQENKTSLVATRSAKDCPNRIEAAWYVMHGDPYYDENYIWTNGKEICRGGMWIKKKSEIPGFSSTSLPSDVTWTNNGCENTSIKKGRPADTSKYFVLPGLGNSSDNRDGNLTFYFTRNGYYWTKDAVDNNYVWILFFYKDAIRVQKWYRSDLNALWAVQ